MQTLGRLLCRSRRSDGTEKEATLFVLYTSDTVDEFIYEKADWESFTGAGINEYYRWTDVRGSEPERRPGPRRVVVPKEAAIDVETLRPGPGLVELQMQ